MCAPAAQRASSKPRSELPTRPTAAGIVRRIPAVDLWTTRQSMQPSAKKCYPCCRIKVLPMLPVAQKEASFTQGVESLRIAILGFPGVFQHPARHHTPPFAQRAEVVIV